MELHKIGPWMGRHLPSRSRGSRHRRDRWSAGNPPTWGQYYDHKFLQSFEMKKGDLQ
jgi:hypothetical protein